MNINELETVIENLKKKNQPYLDKCREASALYKDKKKTNLFPIAAAFLGGFMVRKQGALTFLFGLSLRRKIMQFINSEADHYFSKAKHRPKYQSDRLAAGSNYQPSHTSRTVSSSQHH